MEVIANMDYVFRQQDIKSPSGFLLELLKVNSSMCFFHIIEIN